MKMKQIFTTCNFWHLVLVIRSTGFIIVEVLKEASDVNPITCMWLKVQSSPLLVLKLNEYMKIVEIVMV
jgi:hypothetical protein